MLQCDYPGTENAPRTYCWLDREVFDDWRDSMEAMGGVLVNEVEHSTGDGTLVVNHADWDDGVFDLTVVHGPGDRTHVFIDTEYKDSVMYLSSFTATNTARGRLSGKVATIELKIPEYTYTLDLPIKMPGLRSESEKLWDEMIATLNPKDRAAWERVRRKGPWESSFANSVPEEQFRRELEELEARFGAVPIEEQEYEVQEQAVEQAMEAMQRYSDETVLSLAGDLDARLKESGMSVGGRSRVREFLSSRLNAAMPEYIRTSRKEMLSGLCKKATAK